MNEYSSLSRIYDDMTSEFHYDQIVHVVNASRKPGSGALRVLDVCCGSGTLARLLGSHGCEVVGIDSSAEMINVAIAKTNARCNGAARYRVLDVFRDPWDLPPASFDVVTCTFDSLNYFPMAQVPTLFEKAASVIQGDGALVGDFNSAFKLKTRYGNSFSVESRQGYLMQWRNSMPTDKHIDFDIEVFVAAENGRYDRFHTVHRQYLFEQGWMERQLRAAGFAEITWMDDYRRNVDIGDETLRISFCARKP